MRVFFKKNKKCCPAGWISRCPGFLFSFSSNLTWCRTKSISYARMNMKLIKTIKVKWKLLDCVTYLIDADESVCCVLREVKNIYILWNIFLSIIDACWLISFVCVCSTENVEIENCVGGTQVCLFSVACMLNMFEV